MLPCDNVGVAGYKVYRDGQIVGTPAAPSFEDAGLVADTAYSYAVSGYDAANNESFLSPSLDVITDPAPPPTNVAPVVTISAPADGSSFTEGDSVIFMAAASDTEDGDLSASLIWTSSLNGALNGGAAAASFSTSTLSVGTHTITATATDSGALSGSGAITVTVAAANQAPTAAFSSPCTGLICRFTDGSSDGDGSVVSWSWGFGDGNASTVQNPSHGYAAGGTYTVTLTVTDDGGASESASQGVTVSEPASTGVHVGDIDGSKEKNKNRWRARSYFTIHDTNHSPVSGAIVSHSWSSRDASGSGACTTDGAGRCPSDWTPYLRKGNKSVAFTVDSVASSLQYQSADNHDPDGDSDGIAITIVKP